MKKKCGQKEIKTHSSVSMGVSKGDRIQEGIRKVWAWAPQSRVRINCPYIYCFYNVYIMSMNSSGKIQRW